ncbi:hypothetical protein BKA65DRAFT_259312 [Rhexocercosporidium sp. MPI-PUGE-AT-0058]|nr:hypothetical protein BKA65DRAFT_259312 [Rhexocercosporidium sp. MPI-PUGE-AT-0058]
MVANPQALSDEIDSLLAQYLQLLDEYTSLHVSLSSLQSSIYTNIARANFQAERGLSYGRDSYDQRAMRPARVCRVTGDAEDGSVVFEIGKVVTSTGGEKTGLGETGVKADDEQGKDGNLPSQTQNIEEGMEKMTVQTEGTDDPTKDSKDEEGKDKELPKVANQKDDNSTPQTPDPLRMFGFSIPSALRTAQSSSIQLVESSIPRLATISLQMRALEIQIRRARKYRAKALALEGGRGGLKAVVGESVSV